MEERRINADVYRYSLFCNGICRQVGSECRSDAQKSKIILWCTVRKTSNWTELSWLNRCAMRSSKKTMNVSGRLMIQSRFELGLSPMDVSCPTTRPICSWLWLQLNNKFAHKCGYRARAYNVVRMVCICQCRPSYWTCPIVEYWFFPQSLVVPFLWGLLVPVQSYLSSCEFQEIETPRFQDNRYMKVVRLSALRTGRLHPQEIFLELIPVRSRVDPTTTVLPEGASERKITVIQSRIEPATFRLVAQGLNKLCHRVPPF
jgi:hypothetical protein